MNKEFNVVSDGFETTWFNVNGAYCMKTSCSMGDVTECDGHEKSKHKKFNIL
jgi:hypothetical protein